MRLTGRDRVLAGLFGLQLAAASTFGLVLVDGLGDRGPDQVVAVAQPSAGPTGAVPSASATTGAADDAPVAAATAGPAVVAAGASVKIGAVVTQTGAINFAASAQGTKAYVDMVNAAGGVNGRTLQLDLRDDQLDPARGRAQAQQLVADGTFAFVGWNAPLTENGIVPFLESNRIPVIGAYSSTTCRPPPTTACAPGSSPGSQPPASSSTPTTSSSSTPPGPATTTS